MPSGGSRGAATAGGGGGGSGTVAAAAGKGRKGKAGPVTGSDPDRVYDKGCAWVCMLRHVRWRAARPTLHGMQHSAPLSQH